MPSFILASSSPRRRDLLGTLGIPFTIHKPDIDERHRAGEPPLDYARRLSREKAAHIAARLTAPAAVLAADTVVILSADTMGIDEQGIILGKPADAADARHMLQQLRGRTHQVCTAMTLLKVGQPFKASTSHANTELTQTKVVMRHYSDAEIERYVATGDPFDKAGSYAIQHPLFQPVARIDGCYGNVVGLPLCTLRKMLVGVGWPGAQPSPACRCRDICAGLFSSGMSL
jgi:septum formation protein